MSTEQYQEQYRKLLDMATTLGIRVFVHLPVQEDRKIEGRRLALQHPFPVSYLALEKKDSGELEIAIHLDGSFDYETATYVLAHEMGHFLQFTSRPDKRWDDSFHALYRLYNNKYEAVQNKKTEALVVAYESQAWDYAAELMVMLDIPLSPRFKKERKYALSSYLLKAPKETKERLSKNKS